MAFIERPRYACALGGALSTLNSIRGVAPIIHATAGCGGNLFTAQQSGSGYYGTGFCGGTGTPSSNIAENEIVFGGGERLEEQIETTLEMIDAELYVVTTGCMTEIIADDTEGIVNQLGDDIPVISVETGGFKGNSYTGYELVLMKLFQKTVKKVSEKNNRLVNIFGLVPAYDPFFRGDLLEIKRLLNQLGIQVNTFFSHDEGLENLINAGAAGLNIVFSHIHGIQLVKKIEEIHKIPYWVTDLPIGPHSSADFLVEIGKLLGVEEEIVEWLVDKERREYYSFVERVIDLYTDADFQHYSVVVGNSNNAIGIARFLSEDIGWIPKLIVITDVLNFKQKENLKKHLESLNLTTAPKLIFETDTSSVQGHVSQLKPKHQGSQYYDGLGPLFILGSSLEKDLALDNNAKLLPISYPIINRVIFDRGYAGFRGGLHLFEDLLDVIVAGR